MTSSSTAGGNAYVGNVGFQFPGGEFAPGSLALVTPDGSARVVADGLAFPNGLAVTPDNRTIGESLSYLRHHLALVGRTDPLFAADALARPHRVANGLPRQLNNAATAALIAAAADGKALVDDASAKKAAAELTRW